LPPRPAPPLALVPPLLFPLPVPVPPGFVLPPVGFVPPEAGEDAGVPVSAVPLAGVLELAVSGEPLDELAAGVVDELVVLVVVEACAETLAELPPGTVSVGTPAASVVAEPPLSPPPHAATPSDRARPTRAAVSGRIRRRVPLLIAVI
jgi:hypothetical protein